MQPRSQSTRDNGRLTMMDTPLSDGALHHSSHGSLGWTLLNTW
jgi:hypothetical protein